MSCPMEEIISQLPVFFPCSHTFLTSSSMILPGRKGGLIFIKMEKIQFNVHSSIILEALLKMLCNVSKSL